MNILHPLGPIGAAERTILIDSVAIMLAIVVPTIIAILWFAFWFRSSNRRARYTPDWAYSGRIELVVWAIPALTIILLGGVAWIGSHQLDPARPIDGTGPPLKIQVISLDWKWLFIYPDQRVASVNILTVPVGRPLQFELTSASVMNAFFIPQFGSMIYTMNGMVTRLQLRADHEGQYQGLSAHFSGDGFPDMMFQVNSVSDTAFQNWVTAAGQTNDVLDTKSYADLARQFTARPGKIYRLDDPVLFYAVATQHIPPGPGPSLLAKEDAEVSPRSR